MEQKGREKKAVIGTYPIRAAAWLLAAAVAAAAVLVWQETESYYEKMNICIAVLAAEQAGEDSLTAVTELLKSPSAAEEKAAAERILRDYGYLDKFENTYRKSMRRSQNLTIAVIGLLYIAVCVAFAIRCGMERRQSKNEEDWLCGELMKLRENVPDAGCYSGRIAENREAHRIEMQLESIAENLSLLQRQAALEREEVKSLVTDISHQLKTPVAALKISFENWQSPGLTLAEKEEFKERCAVQIVRLEELVGALIDISRMETGMIQIRRENKNLFDTLALAVSRIYPDVEKKEMEIELDAGEELQKLCLPHDVKWLSEAVINVLENAVKYSPSRSKITIRMVRMTMYLRIEIEDEGAGIPKEEWNEIFKRFYRGRAKLVRQTPGTGVGLYLAREIVRQHQGTLTVRAPRRTQDVQGAQGNEKGSIFVFQLPLS